MECRICKSTELKLFYTQGDHDQFKFYKCSECSLVNLDLNGINIIANQKKYADKFNPPKDYEKEKEAKSAYLFVIKYIPSKGKYMDIGCGSGSMLYFFKKDGWDVSGLELSDVFAQYVTSKLNVPVVVADFLNYKDNINSYDLVSLRHILEHLPNSILAMQKINQMLKPNGYAYFEFPNINSLSHRMQRFRNKFNILKKKYSSSYFPGHCNEFSKESFKYLLNLTGFTLIRWETYSSKKFSNFIYNHFHFGTKARAIVRKIKE